VQKSDFGGLPSSRFGDFGSERVKYFFHIHVFAYLKITILLMRLLLRGMLLFLNVEHLLQQGDNSMDIFGYSIWRPLYRFNISNPNNFHVFVDFMLKFYQLVLLTWTKPRVVKN
jgi:hypothetical protein